MAQEKAHGWKSTGNDDETGFDQADMVSKVDGQIWNAEAYIHRLGYTVSQEASFEVSIGGSNATRTALVTHVLIETLVNNEN